MSVGPQDVTRLLVDLSSGDREAAGQLMPLVYDQLRALAADYFRRERPGHTLQPTALVHEAYVRLVGAGTSWQNRAHFFAVAARVMRHTLVNHALSRKAAKRGGGTPTLPLSVDSTPAPDTEIDALVLDDVLKKLAQLDPRKADVVEMRFFGGLTVEEVAHVLGVSVATVEGDWRMAKAWLSNELSNA